MLVIAKLNHLRIAPRKVRITAEAVKGLKVEEAMKQLLFINKRAANPLLKLFKSALANEENNFKLKKENLEVKELRVDKGPMLKRWMPRAHGAAGAIHKFYSHVTLILEDKTVTESKGKKDKKKESASSADKKKNDEDVVVVKDWDEAKKLVKEEKEENVYAEQKEPASGEEHKPEVENVRAEGKHRAKQNLDKLRKKEKGGILKRIFRRKAV